MKRDLTPLGMSMTTSSREPESMRTRENAQDILASLGLSDRESSPARFDKSGDGTTEGSEIGSNRTGNFSLESVMRPLRKTSANLTLVSLQTTSLAPKESVTYNKETQTSGSGSEAQTREGMFDYGPRTRAVMT